MIVTQRERPTMLKLATKAIDIIFEPKTPFLTGKVMDILFNGIGINCDHSEFEAQVSKRNVDLQLTVTKFLLYRPFALLFKLRQRDCVF